MNNRKRIITIIIFAIISSILIGTGLILNKSQSPISRTFFTADTVCTITLYDGDQDTLDSAVQLCNNISKTLNCYDENSELSKLNKEKYIDSPSVYLLEALSYGTHYSKLQNGVFDITIKPLSSLWNFKNEVIPSKNEILGATKKVDYKSVFITEKSITLKNNAEVDLGGIAKGYIANKIINFLIKSGVKSAVINLGGNVSVIGDNNNAPFSVGIQAPFENSTIATLKASNMSVVTSGIYQRYFEKDNVIYHHLLDTSTGTPVNNSLASVTIITKNPVTADAYSTLCFLLGEDEGMKLIEQTPNLEGIFIDKDKNIKLSSGLEMDSSKIITIKK